MTILVNLANLVKTFPGIIVRQHRTDRKQMALLRERYAGLKKGLLLYCCNQSGLDEQWWADSKLQSAKQVMGRIRIKYRKDL